ncbi:DUF4783 domain-containing protein [Algoriphagus confluentis]|uniref:DUF4783 domain-containing protein n=1 Tax=Algoriphagus confluentis TaxID=1697556 RepID=A0ABQ6PTT8_9BACT|nr:hypothetical protein Aconfl_40380 [Algoriphagus confluentis]
MLIVKILFFFFLVISPFSEEKETVPSIDPIISALESGSSNDLARFFENSITLNINGQQGDYSRNQAELVLKDFFKKNPSQGFSILYQKESPGSISTYIGEYTSSTSIYRVFIKVSDSNNSFRIYSLDFVKN